MAKRISQLAVSKVLREAGMTKSTIVRKAFTPGFYTEQSERTNGAVWVRFVTSDAAATSANATREEREMIEYAELALTEAGMQVAPNGYSLFVTY